MNYWYTPTFRRSNLNENARKRVLGHCLKAVICAIVGLCRLSNKTVKWNNIYICIYNERYNLIYFFKETHCLIDWIYIPFIIYLVNANTVCNYSIFFKAALVPLFPLSTKGRHRFVCLFVFPLPPLVLIWKLLVSLKTVASISDQMLCCKRPIACGSLISIKALWI